MKELEDKIRAENKAEKPSLKIVQVAEVQLDDYRLRLQIIPLEKKMNELEDKIEKQKEEKRDEDFIQENKALLKDYRLRIQFFLSNYPLPSSQSSLRVSPSSLSRRISQHVARVFTRKSDSENWQLSGQCVCVYNNRLFLTATHVCFESRLKLQIKIFYFSGESQCSHDASLVRFSGSMDVSALYTHRDSKLLPMEISTEIPHDHNLPHFLASFAVPFDQNVKTSSKLQKLPQTQRGFISGTESLRTNSESKRLLTYCNSSYVSYGGCSGGAVIVEDSQGRVSLLGIHTQLIWESPSDLTPFNAFSDEDEPEVNSSASPTPKADSTPPSKASESSTPPQSFQLESATAAQEKKIIGSGLAHHEAAEGKKSSQPRFVLLSSVIERNENWKESEIMKVVAANKLQDSPVGSDHGEVSEFNILVPQSAPTGTNNSTNNQKQSSRPKSKRRQRYQPMASLYENPNEE